MDNRREWVWRRDGCVHHEGAHSHRNPSNAESLEWLSRIALVSDAPGGGAQGSIYRLCLGVFLLQAVGSDKKQYSYIGTWASRARAPPRFCRTFRILVVVNAVKTAKCRFAGHIARMSESDIVRRVVKGAAHRQQVQTALGNNLVALAPRGPWLPELHGGGQG